VITVKENLCYCGHDCSRCKIYLGTVTGEAALIEESQKYYKSEFGIDIPLSDIRCFGGRSDCTFRLCKGCPFKKCCLEKGIQSCSECAAYPCKMIEDYEKQYVNQANQDESREESR